MKDRITTALALSLATLALLTSCGPADRGARGPVGSVANTASGPETGAVRALDPEKLALTRVSAGELQALVRSPGARATLVNVWASWCQPCREEFPDLVRLARTYEGKGLRLVFVSADFEEDVPAARKFLAKQGVGWPTYLKTGDDMQFIDSLDARWSGALPGSFLYDESGRLRRIWEGKADYATIEERLLSVLGPSSPKDSTEDAS